MIHIYLSQCGNYVRIVCKEICISCTLSEWSAAIANPGKFNHIPKVTPPNVRA